MTTCAASARDETGAGSRWISADAYDLILGSVPILCADVVLVRDEAPLSIGLIRREVPGGGTGWCAIGGAVLRDEPLAEACLRHVRVTLGAGMTPEKSSLEMLGVFEYFTRPGIGDLCDPRKHAVAVTYLLRSGGQPDPQGEALDFRWFLPGDIGALPSGFGQDRLLVAVLSRIAGAW